MEDLLSVNEIYLTIQGEGTRAGLPCTLVRLAGCNLRCAWCDTQYAWDEGEAMALDDVCRRVAELSCRRVEVTGGEPLLQEATPALLCRLCDAGCETLLETNGSLDIGLVDPRVVRIVDFKCPSSTQQHANRWANADLLTCRDELKFVLADRADYEFARHAVRNRLPPRGFVVLFSVVHGRLPPARLAEWILSDGLDVRLQLPLHRIIWPGRRRRV